MCDFYSITLFLIILATDKTNPFDPFGKYKKEEKGNL